MVNTLGDEGCFLAPPVFEHTFGWQEAELRLRDLQPEGLLSPSLLDTLANAPAYRFPKTARPYVHQLHAWRTLLRARAIENLAYCVGVNRVGRTDSGKAILVDLLTNKAGTFLVSRACIPHLMKAANPHVLNLAPPLEFKPEWFAPYPAYALAKYSMSLYAMAMAEEFRRERIAFNTLWPKTYIDTAAVRHIAGTQARAVSRTPEIMADAAWHILTQPSTAFTGRHCVDEDVLVEAGVRDLRPYRCEPGSTPLAFDLFVQPGHHPQAVV